MYEFSSGKIDGADKVRLDPRRGIPFCPPGAPGVPGVPGVPRVEPERDERAGPSIKIPTNNYKQK